MNELITIVILAIIAQSVVDQLKRAIKFHKGKYYREKINLKVITSMVVSVVLCLSYRVDLLVLLGLSTSLPIIGQLVTAIIISAGASGVNDLISKLNELKGNKKGEF